MKQHLTLNPTVKTRLAPTPSGYLHLGNALNFVLTALVARTASDGGHLLLRIDDLDADRKRPEYVADVFETLDWLGIEWDEGPSGPDDFEARWSQKHRLPLYFNALEKLRTAGLLFACAKSRRDLAPFEGRYPAEFRQQGLSLDAPDVAWRVQTPDDFPLPDFVVRRRDEVPAYQVASLCDDRHFEITHLVRGADLRDSTLAQRWLAAQVGWNDFLNVPVWHHDLLTDPATGDKLSKSAGAASLRAWREAGRDSAAVFQLAAQQLQLADREIRNLNDLGAAFKTNLMRPVAERGIVWE